MFRPKILLSLVTFILAVPLMAQDLVTVTSADGGPGTYVPLLENVSALNSSEIKNAVTPTQMQAAILNQSAVMHAASVQGKPSGIGISTLPGDSPEAAAPTSNAAAASYTPPPFNSLTNSVAFIQHQTAGSLGLPLTFSEPSGVTTGIQAIDNGVGTYDTSLALMALIQNGNLDQAQKILDIYNSGTYGNMALTTINNDAFTPLSKSSGYYYFDTTNVTGIYDTSWQQYGTHTGPNAWLALAVCQYIQTERKADVSDTALTHYLTMVAQIGNAMMMLQDDQTHGAVRYGPHQTGNDPFDTINTENDVDAYSAFNAIAQVMQQSTLTSFSSTASTYSKASAKITDWMQNATVYTPNGQKQTGMRDPKTGLLYVGAVFQSGKWVIQPQIAADSGGTWLISALGPKLIDSMWGRGTALNMWTAIRSNFGRTETQNGNPSTIRDAGTADPLVGLDYSNTYSSNQALISPEWTAGGINALKQLIPYYQANPLPPNFGTRPPSTGPIVPPHPRARTGIPVSGVAALSADLQNMQAFLSQGQDAYAIGPGLTNARQGGTGFNTQAPLNSSIAAMASIYGTLKQDPLATSSR